MENVEHPSGGAGGKHTWGALGSELYAEVMASSQDDPNYDSDSQVGLDSNYA